MNLVNPADDSTYVISIAGLDARFQCADVPAYVPLRSVITF